MIVFECDECGCSITAADERAGGSQTCGNCGTVVTVPPTDTDPSAGTLPEMPAQDTDTD